MAAPMAPHLAAASAAKLMRFTASIAMPMSKVPSSRSSSGNSTIRNSAATAPLQSRTSQVRALKTLLLYSGQTGVQRGCHSQQRTVNSLFSSSRGTIDAETTSGDALDHYDVTTPARAVYTVGSVILVRALPTEINRIAISPPNACAPTAMARATKTISSAGLFALRRADGSKRQKSRIHSVQCGTDIAAPCCGGAGCQTNYWHPDDHPRTSR